MYVMARISMLVEGIEFYRNGYNIKKYAPKPYGNIFGTYFASFDFLFSTFVVGIILINHQEQSLLILG
jgi:hypothetical protein